MNPASAWRDGLTAAVQTLPSSVKSRGRRISGGERPGDSLQPVFLPIIAAGTEDRQLLLFPWIQGPEAGWERTGSQAQEVAKFCFGQEGPTSASQFPQENPYFERVETRPQRVRVLCDFWQTSAEVQQTLVWRQVVGPFPKTPHDLPLVPVPGCSSGFGLGSFPLLVPLIPSLDLSLVPPLWTRPWTCPWFPLSGPGPGSLSLDLPLVPSLWICPWFPSGSVPGSPLDPSLVPPLWICGRLPLSGSAAGSRPHCVSTARRCIMVSASLAAEIWTAMETNDTKSIPINRLNKYCRGNPQAWIQGGASFRGS